MSRQAQEYGRDPSIFHTVSTPLPSLPIIFISVFSGSGIGVLSYYVFYAVVRLSAPWSAGLAMLALIGGVSGTAAFLSTLHDRRTTGVNIGFSCGLMALILAFSGICLLVGVVAATIALYA